MDERQQRGVHMTGLSSDVTVCSDVPMLPVWRCVICRSFFQRLDLSCIQLRAWCKWGPCWARVQHNGLFGSAKPSADAVWGLCQQPIQLWRSLGLLCTLRDKRLPWRAALWLAGVFTLPSVPLHPPAQLAVPEHQDASSWLHAASLKVLHLLNQYCGPDVGCFKQCESNLNIAALPPGLASSPLPSLSL